MSNKYSKLQKFITENEIINEYANLNIELDMNQRWKKGTDHHPRSKELYKHIAAIDFAFCDDSFGFSSGGDGDNGEQLMYLMDAFFEWQDKVAALHVTLDK